MSHMYYAENDCKRGCDTPKKDVVVIKTGAKKGCPRSIVQQLQTRGLSPRNISSSKRISGLPLFLGFARQNNCPRSSPLHPHEDRVPDPRRDLILLLAPAPDGSIDPFSSSNDRPCHGPLQLMEALTLRVEELPPLLPVRLHAEHNADRQRHVHPLISHPLRPRCQDLGHQHHACLHILEKGHNHTPLEHFNTTHPRPLGRNLFCALTLTSCSSRCPESCRTRSSRPRNRRRPS